MGRSRKEQEQEMSRKVHLIALALVAAAVAAPVAQAADRPDDRAGVLGVGLATEGHALRPQPKVDPLAVSWLTGQGLSPSEVRDWTVGACSNRVKPTRCYSAFATSAGPERAAVPAQAGRSGGFHWGDAGIGAGATLGILLMLGALGAAFILRKTGRQQAPIM
jgi:hypothetical protein